MPSVDSIDVLKDSFDTRSFQRGENYFQTGRVLTHATEVQGDRLLVTGSVRGSGSNVYETEIAVAIGSREVMADGECSCPVAFNCKHVVAVLLAERATIIAATGVARTVTNRKVPDKADLHDRMAAQAWLEQIRAAAAPASAPGYLPEQHTSVVYIVAPETGHSGGLRLDVEPVTCRRLKKGGYGKPSVIRSDWAWRGHPPDYLLPDDIEILRRLFPDPYAYAPPSVSLDGLYGAETLRLMLATGRCHWADKDSPALTQGEPRVAEARWQLQADGRQRLSFVSEPPLDHVIALAPPWYFDPAAHCCGELETGIDARLAAALVAAPSISGAQCTRVVAQLEQEIPTLQIAAPEPVKIHKVRQRKPIPHLTLLQTEFTTRGSGGFMIATRRVSALSMASTALRWPTATQRRSFARATNCSRYIGKIPRSAWPCSSWWKPG